MALCFCYERRQRSLSCAKCMCLESNLDKIAKVKNPVLKELKKVTVGNLNGFSNLHVTKSEYRL
jgi:hypothetical protein